MLFDKSNFGGIVEWQTELSPPITSEIRKFNAVEAFYDTESCAAKAGTVQRQTETGASRRATPQGGPREWQWLCEGLELADEELRRGDAGHLIATLERTELQVLRCLVQGMSNRQIVATAALDVGQVESVRASLMKKLGARTTADAVRTALRARLGQLV